MSLDADELLGCVPPGAWGVAVSGGADSVALVHLLHGRADLDLTVIHVDHETRAGESAKDAAFVEALARRLALPLASATVSSIEKDGSPAGPLRNPSARYRAARHAWFARVARERQLRGVLLAHHADDQAETVLLRLVRGGEASGLSAMSPSTRLGELTLLRPLLNVRRAALREYLVARGIGWREDASNRSNAYRRSVARRLLVRHPALIAPLIDLASACRRWRKWLRAAAPELEPCFSTARLANLPRPLALEAARRWLVARGAPPDALSAGVIERLLEMACDAASPGRRHFPGKLLVRRHRGLICVEPG